ncbi:MAG: iron-sulfur cluster insertion protein ErpA [Hyphomicrobiaceae bacterium]
MTAVVEETNVILTEKAAKKINEILAKNGAHTMMRVSVEGGGCSGFQYKFDLIDDDAKGSDDIVLKKVGATVVIDPISASFLGGSEIDFVDDLIGASFQIRNPNATAACGCGTSFSM